MIKQLREPRQKTGEQRTADLQVNAGMRAVTASLPPSRSSRNPFSTKGSSLFSHVGGFSVSFPIQ